MASIKGDYSTSLVSHWRLDEKSGTRRDSHGGNHLTDVNTVTQSAGKVGHGATMLNANNEYLTITDAAQSGLDITGDLTISLWVNFSSVSVGSGQSLVGKRDGSSTATRAYALWLDANGTTTLDINIGDGTTATWKYVTWAPSTSTWYHVVAVYDASAGSVEFYVDGSQQGSTQTGLPTSITNNAVSFNIGSDSSGTSNSASATIDEVSIWSRTLSSSEISAIYNSGSGIPYEEPAATDVANDGTLSTSLVSYWELEESSGTRTDSAGSNDLTDNNTVLSGTGVQGNGADFEATNDEHLSIADASQSGLEPTSTTDWSISCWINLESSPPFTLFSKVAELSSGQTNNYATYLNSTSQVNIISAAQGLTVNTFTMSTATWYHLVVTFDATNRVGTVWINGERQGSTSTFSATGGNNSASWKMGLYRGTTEDPFDGIIDEFGWWSKVLTESEIIDLYNSGSGIPYDAGGGGGSTFVPRIMMAV